MEDAKPKAADLLLAAGLEQAFRMGADKGAREVVRLERINADLLAAAEAAANWLHDPNDAIGHFERLAEEFHRDTGFVRPGKDAAAAAHQDPTKCDIAWNEWRVARGAKVLADLRAALSKAKEGR